jgi:hypothetical protein
MNSIDKADFDDAMQLAFVSTIATANTVHEDRVQITAIVAINASATARSRERRFLMPRSAEHSPRQLMVEHQIAATRRLGVGSGIAVEFLVEADSEEAANASALALEQFSTNATVLQTKFEETFTTINNRTVRQHFETKPNPKTYAMTVAEVQSAEIVTAPPTKAPTKAPTKTPTMALTKAPTASLTPEPTSLPTATPSLAVTDSPLAASNQAKEWHDWFETTYVGAKEEVGLGILAALLVSVFIILGCCLAIAIVKCRRGRRNATSKDGENGGTAKHGGNGKKVKLSGNFRPQQVDASGGYDGGGSAYIEAGIGRHGDVDSEEWASSMQAPVSLEELEHRVQAEVRSDYRNSWADGRDYEHAQLERTRAAAREAGEAAARGGADGDRGEGAYGSQEVIDMGGSQEVIDMDALEGRLRAAEAERERAIANLRQRTQRAQADRREQLGALEEKKRALLLQYAQDQGICADEISTSLNRPVGKKSPIVPVQTEAPFRTETRPIFAGHNSAETSQDGSRKVFAEPYRGPFNADGRVDGTPRNLRLHDEQQQRWGQKQPERAQHRQQQEDPRYAAEIQNLEAQLREAEELRDLQVLRQQGSQPQGKRPPGWRAVL